MANQPANADLENSHGDPCHRVLGRDLPTHRQRLHRIALLADVSDNEPRYCVCLDDRHSWSRLGVLKAQLDGHVRSLLRSPNGFVPQKLSPTLRCLSAHQRLSPNADARPSRHSRSRAIRSTRWQEAVSLLQDIFSNGGLLEFRQVGPGTIGGHYHHNVRVAVETGSLNAHVVRYNHVKLLPL